MKENSTNMLTSTIRDWFLFTWFYDILSTMIMIDIL